VLFIFIFIFGFLFYNLLKVFKKILNECFKMESEEYSLDEVKKAFPYFPKTLPEKLAEDE